ncbi:uncharacterized protein [Dermacentor albipictus]|uniref:uncharacterized protein n=1 Tax=Dermacentor albipictus TaxID=60249 RepID=UPI0038FC4E88
MSTKLTYGEVETPPLADESSVAPQADYTDHTFILTQTSHYTSTEESSNDQRPARKPVVKCSWCSWTSLAVAGFVATVVGALIALAIGHMQRHRQALSLGSNKLDPGPSQDSNMTQDDPSTSTDAGNPRINDTDQAIMFVLNVD